MSFQKRRQRLCQEKRSSFSSTLCVSAWAKGHMCVFNYENPLPEANSREWSWPEKLGLQSQGDHPQADVPHSAATPQTHTFPSSQSSTPDGQHLPGISPSTVPVEEVSSSPPRPGSASPSRTNISITISTFSSSLANTHISLCLSPP